MAALDRYVRRASAHLRPQEGLLASVLGREAGGRRRVALVATDQRILLVTGRPEPITEIGYEDLTMSVDVATPDDPATLVLHSSNGDTTRVERIADADGAQLFARLVRWRVDTPARPEHPASRVRIVS